MDLPKTEITATTQESFVTSGQNAHHYKVCQDHRFLAASPMKSHLWPRGAEKKAKRRAEDTVPTALPPPLPKI